MEVLATFATTFLFQVGLCLFCFYVKTHETSKVWAIRSTQLQTRG